MKRRGPHSLNATGSRQMVTLREPKVSMLRNRVGRAVRRALDGMNLTTLAESQTDVAMIVEGILWVAAQEAAANTRENRLRLMEHGAKFYKAMVSLEAQKEHVDLKREIVLKKAARQVAKVDFDLSADRAVFETFKPVLTRYMDALWDTVGDMIHADDPKGSSLMVCAALMDVAAVVAANAPTEYVMKLEEELIHTFKKRLSEKRAILQAEGVEL